MAYGLSVINPSNIVVIDQDYSNYGVTAEGTLANGSSLLTPAYSDELIFYCLTNNGNSAAITHLDGPRWVVSGELRYVRMRPLATHTLGTATHGLRVFNSSGLPVFDSNSRYFKPVGMYTCNPTAGITSFTNLPAVASGKRLWFSSQVFKFLECMDTGYGFGDAYSTMLVRNSATSYTLTSTSYTGPPFNISNTFQPFQFLVIEA